DAYRDTLDILRTEIKNGLVFRGIKHSFDGNLEIAEEFFQLGFYVGFTGVITFGKNAEELRQLVKNLPLDKILVETDCPYLSPDPHRGERNEPSFVEFTAAKIAELKGVTLSEVAKATIFNTQKLFRI
ncbi:MAG TPA: TatD family hydrolase, partial [Patescibacteria group bacterium]|nr:TatD family hydrolase [Patescibacteria group bacterium]